MSDRTASTGAAARDAPAAASPAAAGPRPRSAPDTDQPERSDEPFALLRAALERRDDAPPASRSG